MTTGRYLESPTSYAPVDDDPPAVFLAGGISGCEDWQAVAAHALAGEDWVVLNPRRGAFPRDDPAEAVEQVAWECHHRRLDRLVMMFWFPSCDSAVTVQPIALLELGAELARAQPGRGLAVGADPGYPRRHDVVLQCRFDRPGLTVHTTLDATLAAARVELSKVADSPPAGRAGSAAAGSVG